jgi:hypothetical protein
MSTAVFPFEKLDNSTAESWALSHADEILAKGWSRRGYQAIDLKGKIPWRLERQEQRSHNFNIQCLDMLDPLLRAHSHSQDRKYLDVALPIALDWIAQHSDPTAPGISPFAWYDMAVGLRAYRLAYLYEAAEQLHLLNEGIKRLFWSSLEQHAAYLADDANIAFHNNHGYYQVAGQLAMARRFADKSPLMADAQTQGRERLKRMLAQQFAPDGVHREHSPDYHRMVYDTLKALIDSGLVDDEETIAFALRIEEALSWFVYPNQHIVNFGDSDDRSLARKPNEAEGKWLTPQMRFWVSGGKIGEPPSELMRAFPEGGYWIVRAPGDDRHDLNGYSYLALNAAFHSRTHKHADDLSFVWFDRGYNLLVDAGRYGYIGKAEQGSELWLDGHWYSDPWRVYCESTRAHNTLEFDGRNFLRKDVKPYGSALRRFGKLDCGLFFAEAKVKQFNSIRHARILFHMPRQWLIVFDWFHDNEKIPHTVKQWFHILHELQALVNGDQYVVPVPGSNQLLRVGSLLSAPIPSPLYIGEEEPFRQGWWSAKERDIVPNYAFCFEQHNVSTGSFATIFSFSDQLEPDLVWSKVNVSGRKGQLRWKDEICMHRLCFERPAEGDLTVTFEQRIRQ